MAIDWAALLDSMITGIGTVITEIVTAISDNAETIAELLIFGVITGAVVKFGERAFRGLAGAVKGFMD